MIADREKVIKGIETQLDDLQKYADADETLTLTQEQAKEILELLKEQNKQYAMMVVDWLRDMAHNNYLDSSHMTFWDAILDIRERAQTGLENYFRDYDSDAK